MPPLDENAAWARYLRSGNGGDLATVYDATAAELLRVAIHLSSSPVEAEDLVQGAYLLAIERRDSFTPGERVRPWLLGILANLARRAARERARRPDADRLRARLVAGAANAIGPSEASEALELTEALDAAIERLPETYRPVLRLRLRHGMDAADIAHALGRPAGSVRTQIVRGLEQLRRMLPASLVAMLTSALYAAPRGLMDVRARVLDAAMHDPVVFDAAIDDAAVPDAAMHGSPQIDSAMHGEATMRHPAGSEVALRNSESMLADAARWMTSGAWIMKKALVALALLLALGACLLWWPEVAHPTSIGERSLGSEQAITASLATRDADSIESEASSARMATSAPEAARTRARLVIDLRWGDEPAPTVGVRVVRLAGTDPFLTELRACSGADGRVVFEPVEAGRYRIETDRDTDAICDIGEREDKRLTIALALAANIEGVVVDEDDVPVAGASIYLSGSKKDLYEGQVVTSSDERGRFAIAHVPGRRFVAASSKGHGPSARALVEPVAIGKRREVLRLVLGKNSSRLLGRVIDPLERPIEGARIRVGGPIGFELDGSAQAPAVGATTDATGHFEIAGLPRGRQRVLVRAPSCAPFYEFVDLDQDTVSHEFRLEAGIRLMGRVTNQNGEPIPDARVAAHGYANLSCRARTARDGRFRIDGLQPECLSIEAQADGYLDARDVRNADVANGVLEWNPVLAESLSCSGRVLTADGRHCAGARIVLVTKGGEDRRATCDRDGRFEVDGLDANANYSLLVADGEDALFVRCESLGTLRAGRRDVEVRLPVTAALRASLSARLGSGGTTAHMSLEQIESGSGAILARAAMPASPHDPSLRSAVLVPGDYNVLVRDPSLQTEFRVPALQLRSGEHRDLGIVTIPRFAELVLHARLPSALSGPVMCEATAHERSSSTVRRLENGRATMQLIAGRYRLVFYGKGIVHARRDIELVAGENESCEVILCAGVQRQLVFVPPAGERFESFDVEIVGTDGSVEASDSFDGEVFWPYTWWPTLAPGVYVARIRTKGGAQWRGDFVVEDLQRRLRPIRIVMSCAR
ncbi:MAG: sigma-70 family RNA polymerase sigma factor [Planctomycetes bacterium]|nr:sigma-70 family RNA polymerase sigma factor [Planctomycetota bacterium]